MKPLNKYQEIEQMKEKALDFSLIIGLIFGSAAFIFSLFNLSKDGLRLVNVTDFSVILAMFLIVLFRKKIPKTIKSFIIIAGIFAVSFTDILKLGLYSDNKLLLIVIPFFAFLSFSLKKTLAIYFFAMIGFIVFAYLFVTGSLVPDVNFPERLTRVAPWGVALSLITIVSFIIVFIVRQFNSTFEGMLDDLRAKNMEVTQREQNYREIFDSSVDAIFIHDIQGNILDVNKATVKMYGYGSKEEFKQAHPSDLCSGDGKYTNEVAIQYIKETCEKGEKFFDWQAKKKNGDYFWVEAALKKTSILGDERILAIVRDIDEKKVISLQLEMYKNHLEKLVKDRTKELEKANGELQKSNDNLQLQKEELQQTLEKLQDTQKQLVQSEKMASVGILAAGVAHEINNPLNFIQGGASGLEGLMEEKGLQEDEEIKVLLGAIGEGISRASSIVTSLNHFNRTGESNTEICDVNRIIDNCIVILHNQLKENTVVHKDFEKESLKVLGNEGKLHQAVLNIIKNAGQAIVDKGIIDIKTQEVENKVVVKIKDNGQGISDENLSRISEPFFTTKEAGAGTGLGLSITYNIIEEHNGSIDFESKKGRGTTVTLTFPVYTLK